MKKTNSLITAAMAVVFVGVLLYLGVYLFRGFHNGYVTAEAVYVDIQESGQAQGIIIRDETLLFSGKPYVDVLAEDGKNIAVGETIATASDTAGSLTDVARIHQLEMQITLAEASANTGITADSEAAIQEALFDLSSAVARRDLPGIYSPEVTITSLLFHTDEFMVDAAQLQEMKAELSQQKAQTGLGGSAIVSPVAGLFTTAVDGYETLSVNMLSDLTPDSLRALTQNWEDPKDYLGKVVVGPRWYFAALVSESDAQRLAQEDTAMLDLGKYASGTVEAVIISISHPQNGVCAVVFKCRNAMAETLTLRELTAEIVYDHVSGLRVPAKAVHVDNETGKTFVYVLSSLQVEKKFVEILATTDNYYILDAGTDVNSLRAGNEVIVSGRNVKEGILD